MIKIIKAMIMTNKEFKKDESPNPNLIFNIFIDSE